MTFCALSSAKGMDIKMKLLAKVSAFEECENIKTILLSQKITYRIEVRNKNNMFKFVTLLFITGSGDFGFRENEGKMYYIFVENKDYQKATKALRQYSTPDS